MPASLPSEEQTDPMQLALQQARNELQLFVYTVSHDLNAPLRAIVGFSRMLENKYAERLDEKGRHYLDLVCQGGSKAQAMLDGLLRYSRLETQAAKPSRVRCGPVLEECITTLSEKIITSNAQIEPQVLPVVHADPAQVKQVLHALLENALTYHAPGATPKVRITSEDAGGGFSRICFTDNGIGIDGSFHARIFEIFKRLHTDEEYPGVGMGLPIARKIAERHGGKIGVESALGRGATFWVTLPNHKAEESYV